MSFQAMYLDGQVYVRPTADFVANNSTKGVYICDTYRLRMTFPSDSLCPLVYEIGGKIMATAMRKGKAPVDLHTYSGDGGLCLASTMELGRTFADGFSLPVFVDEFVVPFLFAQSNYALHDTWLWGELSHGAVGLIQWLGRQDKHDDKDVIGTYYALTKYKDRAEVEKLLGERCRGHKPCPCGSGNKARNCCPELINAIASLRGAMSRGLVPRLGDV